MSFQDTAPGIIPGAVLSCPGSCHLGLIVRYDGTDYHGFQRQAGQPTVQAMIEQRCQEIFGPGRLLGASRTDAGVHAEGQVVVWQGPVPLPMDRVAFVLNHKLPRDIQVVRAFRVREGWDPRRQPSYKQYSYRIWRGSEAPPLALYRFAWWNVEELSWRRLHEASNLFLGAHDFRAFRTEGSSAETTVRTIVISRWASEQNGRIWRYQVMGTGFLYRMVRHMVAAMIEAAKPGGTLAVIQQGLADPRGKVGALTPARGLTLDHIQFRD